MNPEPLFTVGIEGGELRVQLHKQTESQTALDSAVGTITVKAKDGEGNPVEYRFTIQRGINSGAEA